MLDYQLYGLQPGGHHLTNVLLHAAVAGLLFLVLWRMTGDCWPAAFVAAVFAVHPLRVESVAWVAERKDVLCGLFFMLTLGAYWGYAQHPFSRARYALVLVLFALGLMAKPMLVSLPLVLLLLDYWPLGRMSWQSWRRLGQRKRFRLLAMAAVCGAVTIIAQDKAVAIAERLPISARLANASVSCRCLPGTILLSGGIGRFLSSSGKHVADLESGRVRAGAGRPFRAALLMATRDFPIGSSAGSGIWECSCR